MKGEGVIQDSKTAEDWFVKAAETGDSEEQAALGTRYAQGAFGKVDYVRAKEWWEKAAEQNHLIAMWDLGDMYQRGEEGVPQDRHRAFAWFERAAEAGLPTAMERVGLAYLIGTGTTVDVEKAKEWLVKAAENGNASTEGSLGTRFYEGDFGEKDVATAAKWWERAAGHGDATAMCNLGQLFSDPGLGGDEIRVDLETARKWFRDADEAGNVDAAYYLGLDALGSLGSPFETYAEWQAAFRAVNPEADPAKRVLRKATVWFRKTLAAHAGDTHLAGMILCWLARIARYQENSEGAKDLYRQAAENGAENAQLELAEMESKGDTVEEPEVMAESQPSASDMTATSVARNEAAVPPVAVAAPVVPPPADDETSRAEALFLRRARRLKRNGGRIGPDEKKELRELAAELGLSVLRREELLEQVEEEYEAGTQGPR